MLLTTFTCPRPPRTFPTNRWQKRNIRWVIPPVFMRFPTRMKKGMARRANPVVLEYIRAGTIRRRSDCPRIMKKITEVKPMETAMGCPKIIRTTRTVKINAVIMACGLPFLNESGTSAKIILSNESSRQGRGAYSETGS
jgi:hypothetical protein